MKKTSLIPALLALLTPAAALAQTNNTATNTTGPSIDRTADSLGTVIETVNNIIKGVTNLVVGEVAGSIVALMLVIGGIQYITGNKEGGKKTITAAIIGAVIIIMSYAIVGVVNIIK